uniref:FRIGIDA-like protein n=1 Tax=Kalanchoe fedtschenkoi TaxID=63787 RepID=A0A7N0UNH7_KALFE
MEDTQSVAMLMDSTTSKIQQLQKAFEELETHRTVALNLKWKQLEEHLHGLENALKTRFTELEDQEREFKNKTIESQVLLHKREAVVKDKEQESLLRLQEKRDAALICICSALGKRKTRTSEGHEPRISKQKVPYCKATENNAESIVSSDSVDTISYPEMVKLCAEMNPKSLHKFISDNRKNLIILRRELPYALKAAESPATLVLDSLAGFYCTDVPNEDGKKNANLLGLRRTCIMLMECMSILLTDSKIGVDSEFLSENVKEKAKEIAAEWKPKLDALDAEASNGNSLEAHAFLQLIATFDIASDFNQEDISKYLPMVSRRRQTAGLFRILGFTQKIPGLIEVLIKNGRHIDALNLSFAFNLTEKFSPVPLLKSYMTEATKTSSLVKVGNSHPTAQMEVNDFELTALKTVIKCIEEHKLEDQYPLDPLQMRVIELEKVKTEKNRETEPAKPQPKRPRANGLGCAHRLPNSTADKTHSNRVPERCPHYMYAYPPPPNESICGPLMGSTAYNLSHGHGNYFGNAYQYQQAAYLH